MPAPTEQPHAEYPAFLTARTAGYVVTSKPAPALELSSRSTLTRQLRLPSVET